MSESPSGVKIRNMRRRMIRLSLGSEQRGSAIVHVTDPVRSKGRGSMSSASKGGTGRRRISVDSQLIIPAMSVIDKLPDGGPISKSIRSVPSIKAALDRNDIRIEG